MGKPKWVAKWDEKDHPGAESLTNGDEITFQGWFPEINAERLIRSFPWMESITVQIGPDAKVTLTREEV